MSVCTLIATLFVILQRETQTGVGQRQRQPQSRKNQLGLTGQLVSAVIIHKTLTSFVDYDLC